MPFTFCHPAIVLPLTYLPGRWFSLTGLVVGTMVPDFEYFIRMRLTTDISHTIAGLFLFDLPLGILLTFIYHDIVRNSLFDNLPVFLKSRFSPFRQFNWNSYFRKHWLIVIISILIGATSHILWDNVTKEKGYLVQIFAELTNTTNILGRDIPFLTIVKHLNSLVGALVIAFAIYKLQKVKIIHTRVNPKYWTILIGLALIIILLRLVTGLDLSQFGNVIVTAISAGLISVTLTPFLTQKIE